MTSYRYKAIDETGNNLTGLLEADSVQSANNILVSRGLIPQRVTEEAAADRDSLWAKISALGGGIKTRDLVLFTKQFRSMLNAGVPIIRIMQVLEVQTESRVLRQAVTAIVADIRQGSTISDAFAKHPRIFSHLYCSMLRAGELSGSVTGVLDR
ncbi:MAG: type II secretion system F family protein, partial [Smithellaceae bacterium]|nr:type II secretion system F family protein [Smithellaceae bacterium]